MTVRYTSKWAAAMTTALLLAACGGGGNTDQVKATADTLSTATDGAGLVVVGNKLFSIPSPVQTALLIRELGLPYNNSQLISSSARKVTSNQRNIDPYPICWGPRTADFLQPWSVPQSLECMGAVTLGEADGVPGLA